MFKVFAAQRATDQPSLVYLTSDEENASCFAESHFINRGAVYVRAADEKGRTLKDRNSKDYIWQRV